MSALTIGQTQARQKDVSREVLTAAFWDLSSNRFLLKDSERLMQIKKGFAADLFQTVRIAFDLQERSFATLFNVSVSKLRRYRREQKPLDSIASERLDRIFSVGHLAQEVFGSREAAGNWLSKPIKSLGTNVPIMLCETEIGAKQVRRVLQSLAWGGTA